MADREKFLRYLRERDEDEARDSEDVRVTPLVDPDRPERIGPYSRDDPEEHERHRNDNET
ncbi:hypothetical protein [Deinococcus pimensis]|uniref:hypothetical protein n=1 Tax=Deinococcus pimensis TaxID=309888 RepID=UPI0004844F13|nr:hypothetical protein [Deinococcus pimensis]